MGRQPKEYQAFTSLVDRLLKVSTDEILRREAAYKAAAAKNPRKRPFIVGCLPHWSDQFRIHHAASDDTANHFAEPLRVIQSTLVEPKRLFVQIAE